MITTKVCYKCKVSKSTSGFSRWKRSTDGYQTWCKDCVKEYGTVEKHREKCRELQRKRRENPEYKKLECEKQKQRMSKNAGVYLAQAARARSKKSGLPYSITTSDIIIPAICPILKVPFKRGTPYAPSIDRIECSRGYVPGNIMVISRKANSMKNNATKEELIEFSKFFLTYFKEK